MPQALRHWLIILVVALIASASAQLPLFQRADGLSIDVLFWLRHQLFGPLRSEAESPTVVIAIDEETYRRPPFQDVPKALWTPQLAKVLEATLAAGALVIGQDLILPTSVERYLKGYDRSYLLALRQGSRDGRIVLGKVQHLAKPLAPFPGHSFAVGHQKNIRLVNLFRDVDGVIRRVPLTFRGTEVDGSSRVETSMALELAARALGRRPDLSAGDRVITLSEYRIPGSIGNAMLLNFDTGEENIPTYSMADLYQCAEAGRADFFERAFKGKIVLIGSLLDVEDRKLTSKRFVTGAEVARTRTRCVLPVMEDLYDERVIRDTIPGVYIFATAVNNLLRGDALEEPSKPTRFALLLMIAIAAGAAGLRLRPATAAMVTAGAVAAWILGTTMVFRTGTVLPLFDTVIVAVASLMVLAGYRFGVTDREKRAVRRAFSYYLPDLVIDRMLAQGATPKLGGESRDVTVLISDLEGFTAMSEDMPPQDVVQLMNRYLSAMTAVIEAHGGFIDKYIGDAIVAVFGAPLEDPAHALQAVRAALRCQESLIELQPCLELPPGQKIAARIGLNSGPVLIGNIGGEKRFNYTVMGDTVNLATRLEGVNKLYGTRILVSAETAARCGDEIRFREIDCVRVLGRSDPVVLFEPKQTDGESDDHAAFAEARAALRIGDFTSALTGFEALAAEDPAAAALAERCRLLLADPPPPDWDGIRDLDRK